MSRAARVDSAHITPSAHYTGYVWYRHQLAEEPFVTPFGRFAHGVLAPVSWGARVAFGLDVERFLLQRHLLIDALSREAIDQRGVRQVVEIACGLSPRGRRFCSRYPQLRYLEADLPPMAARKRLLLHEEGWLNARHQVRPVDILAEQCANDLQALFSGLDRDEPLLVITEGLVNYFELPVIEGFWARLAAQMRQFPSATYLTDLYPDLREHPRYRQLRWGIDLVGRLTRGRYYLHYRGDDAIVAGFEECGFGEVRVHDPKELETAPVDAWPALVRVVEGRV
ncbi:class I SAM-dependent methyltransferase [Metapseudomonas lalkuanensis]|uniref:class I SAM-dependent methyltransferase n=1 Tax=Metapseudomonas lalkuanensis TaxID=2604832 RepID=UPI001CF29FDC|nr:class I SAM-dependent methyltransferase [Pseudomonas lalkuanensis]UCO98936.1 class I SAM-dependent methyltransferase [Pseudomonas lalkuanensis]